MRRLVYAILPLVLLAACDHKATEETQTVVSRDGVTTTTITTKKVDRDTARNDQSTGAGLKIDSDDFKANVEIPGLSFGGNHMDLNGMKLYPGSTVKGMHVRAVDRGGVDRGEVVVDFASPAAPATVARHMADSARNAGYAVTTDNQASLSGTKTDGSDTDSFTATLAPNGDATVGHLTLAGKH